MAKSSKRSPKTKVSVKKVLCATDLSECSAHALSQAAELAEAHDARLLVVHVVEMWDDRYDFLVKDISKKIEAEAREKLAAELAHLGKTDIVPLDVEVRKGNAAVEIVKLIKESKADLVVVGSHGRGAVDRFILGSVAEKVLRLSPVSVLVARPAKRADFESIVCGMDLSPTSALGLEWSLDLAERERLAQVAVVNTFEVPTGYLEAGMTYETARDKMYNHHEKNLKQMLNEHRHAGIAYKPLIEEGPSAETIVKVAEREGADLIIVGSHGRSRLAALLLGSVTAKLVRIAHTSILAVKGKQHRKSILEMLEYI